MAVVLFGGGDETIAEAGGGSSGLAGNSGVPGRTGLGICARRGSTTLSVMGTLATALSSLWCGFGFRISSIAAGRFVAFVAPDGTTVHCAVGLDASGHLVVLGPANTTVATSTVVLSPNVWYYIEVKVVIADSGGTMEVRQDETVVLTFTGDTRNGTATTAGFISNAGPGSNNTDFDDFYVDDAAYQGDITVIELLPSGDGDSSGWLGSDGNSVNNSLLVDEPTTPNVTDYVAASVSGTQDLYQMADLPSGTTYSVIAIQEQIYALKSDAGTSPVVLPVAKGQSGTTRADSALPALSTVAQLFVSQIRTTDPDGNALTTARVNAMQVGVKIQ